MNNKGYRRQMITYGSLYYLFIINFHYYSLVSDKSQIQKFKLRIIH
jgi:hypothetical protein